MNLVETKTTKENTKRLIDYLRQFDRVTIAFSGGVDSSVVAAAAMQAGLDSAVAVTGWSPSVSQWQIDWSERIADQIGIDHRVVKTEEGSQPNYIRNDAKRCFYCKESLYRTLAQIADQCDQTVLISGTNADDLGDYRPGIEAGKLASVKTPLADLGFGKIEVRALARWFNLENAELPASPCLASRVAYGVDVTPERLARIEQAENWLRDRGFSDLRVRIHADELARVEVPVDELYRLFDASLAAEMNKTYRSLGFRYVTVDTQGLQSGSLNRALVSIETSESRKGISL
ncbi:tRNA-specific 2-thiouridylase MnmA [Planctomycetes bacterium CA13]|uniref:tRNA-specific 2-thiouridylase MnmA n=1 Tax=Novipirellula herctigrandis TaxID=2527986 RepID=A0A5C5Z5C9_9BACT|nr:tRNA-specific 2-thiouridylase MnmA [Planctomycetes bacterium CA13]